MNSDIVGSLKVGLWCIKNREEGHKEEYHPSLLSTSHHFLPTSLLNLRLGNHFFKWQKVKWLVILSVWSEKKLFFFWFLVSQHLQNTYCCYYGVTKLGKPAADTPQARCFGSQFLDTSLQDRCELLTIMWRCGWSRRAGTFLEAGGRVEL